MRPRPRLRNQAYTTKPEVRYPTDEELERATQAVMFEAGRANDPKVKRDSANPAFWTYAQRYALAALMSYLNP